jgi:hypothetical protein
MLEFQGKPMFFLSLLCPISLVACPQPAGSDKTRPDMNGYYGTEYG